MIEATAPQVAVADSTPPAEAPVAAAVVADQPEASPADAAVASSGNGANAPSLAADAAAESVVEDVVADVAPVEIAPADDAADRAEQLRGLFDAAREDAASTAAREQAGDEANRGA